MATHTLRITLFGTTYEGELPGPPWLCGLVLVGWISLPFLSSGNSMPPPPVVRRAPGPSSGAGVAADAALPRTGGGDEGSPADPRDRSRLGVIGDVGQAFEIGVDSGLVYLETRDEQRLFDHWKSLARFGKHDGSLTLFWDGDENLDGTRTYVVSLDGASTLGKLTLQKLGDRWHVVGVSSPEGESRDAAEKARIRQALKLRLEESEDEEPSPDDDDSP